MRMIDPPSGWHYGFPKAIPDDVKDVKAWLVENGYPKSLIEELGEYFYCRYWDEVVVPSDSVSLSDGDAESIVTFKEVPKTNTNETT